MNHFLLKLVFLFLLSFSSRGLEAAVPSLPQRDTTEIKDWRNRNTLIPTPKYAKKYIGTFVLFFALLAVICLAIGVFSIYGNAALFLNLDYFLLSAIIGAPTAVLGIYAMGRSSRLSKKEKDRLLASLFITVPILILVIIRFL